MTTVIFINQLRMKIGVFFGNPETTTGGERPQILFNHAPRYNARYSAIKQGQDVIGNRVRVKVVKNKSCSSIQADRV